MRKTNAIRTRTAKRKLTSATRKRTGKLTRKLSKGLARKRK